MIWRITDKFAKITRDIIIYDIPWYWNDEKIFKSLQQIGHIIELKVKRSFKYKLVKAKLRFTKQ